MNEEISFKIFFRNATGNEPFPWQIRMYNKFVGGIFPDSANIPTGLGKTSIVAIWLIALALHPDKMPRRLVYVVNRRTVVDQTTTEVEKMRNALLENPELKEIADALRSLCALPLPTPDSPPLAISTLRGQFADNREWSADPSRPAVIIGTVDMIGSGLLFSRYTVGFKLRPHHAALLAQDVLLVHDEAHLEPAFQQLLVSIVNEQARCNDFRKLHVIELSATTRSEALLEPFKITEDDERNEFVYKRINAVKKLSLVEFGDGQNERDKIIEFALALRDTGRAILIFVRSVESANKIAAELNRAERKDQILMLTGTMRGKERDELVRKPIFQRFLPESSRAAGVAPVDGTVFLVATSAGEVGVNISADDLICDLSTYESMAQRFGRINRFGERDDSTIVVAHETTFGKKDKNGELVQTALDIARERTLALLKKLDGNACPADLDRLSVSERGAAFSPLPEMRVATEVQFDAWALSSIRERIAARPPVAPYLHGETEWQPPETQIAWRDDVDDIQGELLTAYPPDDLLDDFPLKPHELLRDRSSRIAETLSLLIEKNIKKNDANLFRKKPCAWLLRESGTIEVFSLIPSKALFFAYSKEKERNDNEKAEIRRHKEELESKINDATIILPPTIGGMSRQGIFDSDSQKASDVADIDGQRLRIRADSPDVPEKFASDYSLVRAIDTRLLVEDDNFESPNRYWLWLEAKSDFNVGKHSQQKLETLSDHTKAVVANAAAIAQKLLPAPFADEPDLRHCLIAAGELHDAGKNRCRWQFGIGNRAYDPANPNTILAKPGGSMRPRNLAESYRHEFGSLSDAIVCNNLDALTPIERDIVLHMIASHHGRARPHFPIEEMLDYNSTPDTFLTRAAEVPRRFSQLQRRFGRWGLVWIESLLRAADYASSAGIIAKTPAMPDCSRVVLPENRDNTVNSSTMELRIDVTNPGQYFACCGLFELATRLAPNALAHFRRDADSKLWRFIITHSNIDGKPLSLYELLAEIAKAEIINANAADINNSATDKFSDSPNDSEDGTKDDKSPPLQLGSPFRFRLDWWVTADKDSTALKVWAGSMNCLSITRAMQNAIGLVINESDFDARKRDILFDSRVVYESEATSKKYKKRKKKEPFYFDARRGPNADSRDVGFAPNDLKLETVATFAVEILCLFGLQRAMPAPAGRPRQFIYNLWTEPLPVSLLAAAVNGRLPGTFEYSYRFESWFRTSQKKHKAFLQATPIRKG